MGLFPLILLPPKKQTFPRNFIFLGNKVYKLSLIPLIPLKFLLLPLVHFLFLTHFPCFLQINLENTPCPLTARKRFKEKELFKNTLFHLNMRTGHSWTSLSKSLTRLGEVDSIISTTQRFYFACSMCRPFLGFSGEFCLPQLDPEFLVTQFFLYDDWTGFNIGGTTK